MNSRTIIKNFMSLTKQMKVKKEIKEKIDRFIKSFQRKDLRKRSAKITLWNFLEDLRGYDSIKDPIDGMMAYLAEKWGGTLGKALREQKIS